MASKWEMMAETLQSNSPQEAIEAGLSFEDVLAMVEGEASHESEVVLQQLQEIYGDRLFRYKTYSGTVAHLFNVCPAFEEVVAKGFDYASNWLESNDQPEEVIEDKVDEPTKTQEDENITAEPEQKSTTETVETPAKADAAKADMPAAEVAPATQAINQAQATQAEADTPARQGGDTPTDSRLSADHTVKNVEPSTPRSEAAPESGGAPMTIQPKDEAARPAAEVNDQLEHGGVVASHDNDRGEAEPISAEPTAEPMPVFIEPTTDEAVQEIEAKGQPSVAIDTPADEPDAAPLEAVSVMEHSAALPVEEASESEPVVELSDEYSSDELPTLEFETGEAEIDTIEDIGDMEEADDEYAATETDLNGESFAYETTAEVDESSSIEHPAVIAAQEVLEQYESEAQVLPAELVAEEEKAMPTAGAEVLSDTEMPVQEAIEIIVEMTGELPESLPEIDSSEVINRIDSTVQAIQTLESAHTAEQCHEALTEIRRELASLLKLLGYDNADAVAKRLVSQYDTASLRQYLAQLVRILESRRSESTISRQFKPRPSYRQYGIHAVGTVVMLGGGSHQLAA